MQGIVAARLYFWELLRLVVPITGWWADKRVKDEKGKTTRNELQDYGDRAKTISIVQFFIESARKWSGGSQSKKSPGKRSKGKREQARNEEQSPGERPEELNSLDRYVLLTGLLLWAIKQKDPDGDNWSDCRPRKKLREFSRPKILRTRLRTNW